MKRISLIGRTRLPTGLALLLFAITAASLWARDAARRGFAPETDRRMRMESGALPAPPVVHDPRLPAEFEPQQAILISGSVLIDDYPRLFADLVSALRGEVAVYVLINDDEEQERGEALLRRRRIPLRAVTFLPVPHDSPWVRDYGPQVTQDPQGLPRLVDARYGSPERLADEDAPFGMARLLNLPIERTPLLIEGGNLLSNGCGHLLTTTVLRNLNGEWGISEEEIRDELRRVYGAREVIFLEPVMGESTGHVDTFATFVAPDAVVLASCDPEIDPLNAEILDRNAARLSRVRLNGAPMRVLRVPTPHGNDGSWRSYTNVLYANRAVLIPVYRGIDPRGRRRALEVFRSCFPDRRIVSIDASDVASLEGALHCLHMNLGPASLPALDSIGNHSFSEE